MTGGAAPLLGEAFLALFPAPGDFLKSFKEALRTKRISSSRPPAIKPAGTALDRDAFDFVSLLHISCRKVKKLSFLKSDASRLSRL